MSDSENPYASPQTESVPAQSLMPAATLTNTMVGYLKEAAPWLRFIGIMGYIGCGFMAVSGITTIAAMGALSSLWESALSELGSFGNVFNAVFSVSMGAYFLAFAVLFFFPSRFTYNFGAKIRSYLQNGKEEELELALKNNKSLWKFYGIMMIIELAAIPVLIVIGIIAAVVAVFV